MSNPNETYIAKGKKCKHWHATSPQLLIGGDPGQWRLAVQDYFRGRLQDRYLGPIKTLQQSGRHTGEGFSIVALQCSLVEFLESTIQGTNYRYLRKGEKLGPHEYSGSKDIFVDFLCKRQPFQAVFGPTPTLAEDFYASVRCGLLHEARTKNGWRILAGSSSSALVDGAGRIVYRNGFQAGLLKFVAWYEQAVPTDTSMQEAFIRKFDALCQ
jgi:hypothetical protein